MPASPKSPVPTVRFAPSPTGRLHVGNLRVALLNWLFARKGGGSFILRLDDTDRQRSTEAFAAGIREDLTWLGLAWDREERQSARSQRYAEVAESLRARGRLYACYETEDELDRRRKRQMARGLPPIYDRAALKLSADERVSLEAAGRRPHWRFRLDNIDAGEGGGFAPRPTLVSWNDLVRGDQTVDVGSLSDPVLIREDGTCLYTFTSVVDDIDFAITHVIRGEDHVTNTGVQIQIFEALGAEPPAFAHHGLLVGAKGEPLSKRDDSLSIAGLREMGLEPLAIACHAALIGTSDAIEPVTSLDALAQRLDLAKVASSPARFDPAELAKLNARLLHAMAFAEAAPRLAALGIGGGEAFWLAVRGNLERLADASHWHAVVAGEIEPVVENAGLCEAVARLLPPEPWDGGTWDEAAWKAWKVAVVAATGAKGQALFHPLRLALTGRERGPELNALLPLMGRQRALARLAGRRG